MINRCEIMQFKLQFEPTITLNSDMNYRKYMIKNENDFIMVDYLKSDNDIHTFKYKNCVAKKVDKFFTEQMARLLTLIVKQIVEKVKISY